MRILPLLPLLALLTVLALGVSLSARAADISVGAGQNCTVHTIADAMTLAAATPEADTVRLANDQEYFAQTAVIGTAVLKERFS